MGCRGVYRAILVALAETNRGRAGFDYPAKIRGAPVARQVALKMDYQNNAAQLVGSSFDNARPLRIGQVPALPVNAAVAFHGFLAAGFLRRPSRGKKTFRKRG